MLAADASIRESVASGIEAVIGETNVLAVEIGAGLSGAEASDCIGQVLAMDRLATEIIRQAGSIDAEAVEHSWLRLCGVESGVAAGGQCKETGALASGFRSQASGVRAQDR